MPPADISPITARRSTYASYSVGSAAVWTVILAVGRRRLDARTWDTLRLVAGGWWTGWLSATIARVGYPPPKPLTPEAKRRLETVSLVLVAAGLISVIRLLLTGKRSS